MQRTFKDTRLQEMTLKQLDLRFFSDVTQEGFFFFSQHRQRDSFERLHFKTEDTVAL